MSTRQTFGSALKRPWALVRIGCNCPIGRRPATEVVYLTDDEGDHYLGGVVSFYRGKDEPAKRWHYSYKSAKRIPKSDVLHIFPHSTKSPWGGPDEVDVRRARKALPVTTEESDYIASDAPTATDAEAA
jgi:hypothetical protein